MDVGLLYNELKKIKVYLVFFCFMALAGCRDREGVHNLYVDYEKNKAVGVTFNSDMDVEKLRIFLGKESEISVIGVIVSFKDKHTFTPAIPFTTGQTYSIREGDTTVVATFTVSDISTTSPPELLAIYPTRDSVPENLLKMYLQFSQPMQEVGNALDFISVHNNTDGMRTEPFLKLETELWSKDHTLLTLWFDPGRIKTDLIPNQEQGLPLVAGKEYTISISDAWKGANGRSLGTTHSKKLYAKKRDMQRPKMEDWKLTIMENDANKSLLVDFGESLDAFLAQETVKVYDSQGSEIEGTIQLQNKETALKFTPTKEWITGDYELRVQSHLEDLAGNNLNRLFDTNLKKASKQGASKRTRSIPFKVH